MTRPRRNPRRRASVLLTLFYVLAILSLSNVNERKKTMTNLALPGNPRYQPKDLQAIFGYDNLMQGPIEVEIAVLQTLGEIGVIPRSEIELLTPEVIEDVRRITTTEVDEVERKITKHDIRALVMLIQKRLPEPLRRWVHVPLTSYDVLDTGRIMQFLKAHDQVVLPLAVNIIRILGERTREEAASLQIGRTHGQHALPITVGFWLATLLSRILHCAEELGYCADNLAGKISGAVGAYNAQVGLNIECLCEDGTFEGKVLARLGISPARISTQILPPEPLAQYLFLCVLLSAALAQLGRDCRNLMRSEIEEIGEPFAQGQVGSSTMAHKRNPINFEQLEGMFLKNKSEFGKVLDTLVSEHQRDLVGSSLMRDFPTIVVNLVTQMNTLLRKDDSGQSFLGRIKVDRAACERNFRISADVVLAEPLYIALQMAGYGGDAHKLVNHEAMPLAKEQGISLVDAVAIIADNDEAVAAAMRNIPEDVIDLLHAPEKYIGKASEKTLEIAKVAKEYVGG